MRTNTPELTPNDAYGSFLKDIREKDPKILPEEELKLKIGAARNASLPEEKRLEARNEVFDSVLRTIPFVIKRLPKSGIPPEELVGEAAETINSCIDNFNLDFISPKTEDNPHFSSYVIKSLEKKFVSPRSVVRTGELISIPQSAEELSNSMRRARELFMQENHREPNYLEWYARTVRLIGETKSVGALRNATIGAFERTERAKFKKVASIGRLNSQGHMNTDTLGVKVGEIANNVADDASDTEEEALKNILVSNISDVLASLPQIERTILEMRYGIGLNEDGKERREMTLEEVARVFDTFKERIRQIESKALRKLRHPSRSRKILDFQKDDKTHRNWNVDEWGRGRMGRITSPTVTPSGNPEGYEKEMWKVLHRDIQNQRRAVLDEEELERIKQRSERVNSDTLDKRRQFQSQWSEWLAKHPSSSYREYKKQQENYGGNKE